MNDIAAPMLSYQELISRLHKAGMLDAEQSKLALRHRASSGQSAHPVVRLASQGLLNQVASGGVLDEACLTQWLAAEAGLAVATINPLSINVAATTAVMSYPFAKRHQILCLAVSDTELVVATAQPFSHEWLPQLAQTSRRNIIRQLAKPSDIERYSLEFYAMATSVSGASGNKPAAGIGNFEQLLELGKLKDPEANDQHIVNIVDWLLQYAFDQRASDIHLEPRRDIARVRFRIDGVLHQVYELPVNIGSAVISRLKILGRMDVAEKRKPQDGRIKTKRPDQQEIELRLSTLPTAFGEKLVMRVFDPEVLLRDFASLGLTGSMGKLWQQLLAQPYGIVLVTGPTGSGKTTTLYSSLKRLATPAVNVCTIEDPIEMVEDTFNQTQVQPAIGLDFAAGLRTLLRQDPDIIMVGEIRDLETAQMAAQAALTGHLVLSSLHTNDAASGITRLLDLGVPAYLLRSAVVGIMAQRLVRTLCPHCKRKSAVSETKWHALVAPWQLPTPAEVYQPVGCLECRNTGYLGRQGIYEILPLSPAIQAQIQTGADLAAIQSRAVKEGMRFLRIAGAEQVAAGNTTIEEVLRVAPPNNVGVDKKP